MYIIEIKYKRICEERSMTGMATSLEYRTEEITVRREDQIQSALDYWTNRYKIEELDMHVVHEYKIFKQEDITDLYRNLTAK